MSKLRNRGEEVKVTKQSLCTSGISEAQKTNCQVSVINRKQSNEKVRADYSPKINILNKYHLSKVILFLSRLELVCHLTNCSKITRLVYSTFSHLNAHVVMI